MKSHTPRYINVEQSFLRKIKTGWYATDRGGGLLDGPFANRERCLARISQHARWVTSSTARERAV
jgi:hypothetical protein